MSRRFLFAQFQQMPKSTSEKKKLLELCHRMTPLVAENETGFCLDITGCSHLFGGEREMLMHARKELTALGFTVALAISSTPLSAQIFTRCKDGVVIEPEHLRAALLKVPISVCGFSPKITDSLFEFKITHLKDLLAVPKTQLVRRFGYEVIQFLDELLDTSRAIIEATQQELKIKAEFHFAHSVRNKEILSQVSESLIEKICVQLRPKKQGIKAISICFKCTDKKQIFLETSVTNPTLEPKTISDLVRLKLEKCNFNDAVDAITVHVKETERLEDNQLGFVKDRKENKEISVLLDKLRTRLGQASVFWMLPRESHVPEKVMEKVIHSPNTRKPFAQPTLVRPLRLLKEPEPITAIALFPDYPPKQIQIRKRIIRIVKAEGPERILREWWNGDNEEEAFRDYYRIEDAKGHRFWIYRKEDTTQWFLHGVFG